MLEARDELQLGRAARRWSGLLLCASHNHLTCN
jgi:hypothetical protein